MTAVGAMGGQVLPGEACRPKPANKWQWAFAVALAALTAGSCLQLGLASNVFLLPKVHPPARHHRPLRSSAW